MKDLHAAGRIVQTKLGNVPQYKRYLDEMPGVSLQNDWDDILPLHGASEERLGYSTQKPLALMERIIAASSDPGDVVLDPFCGCGTTIEAAQKHGRRWIGIDVTYLAIHVIEERLKERFKDANAVDFEVFGKPRDAADAKALAARDWLEFQKWAVMMLGGVPKVRPGADKGIDGEIRYHKVGIEQPNRAIVSVKGGQHVGVDAVHKLKSVMDREGAETGVLVCLESPTKAMRNEALAAGDIQLRGRRIQRLQIITVDKLFERGAFDVPGTIDPPEVGVRPAAPRPKRGKKQIEGQIEMLLPIQGKADAEQPKQRVSRAIRSPGIEVVPRQSLAK